jgi:ribosomal protein S8
LYFQILNSELNKNISCKKLFFFFKYNKIVFKYLQFLLEEGFILRVVRIDNNLLQIYLKYLNGFSVFKYTNLIVSKKNIIYLSVKQLIMLKSKYPLYTFIFYTQNTFFSLQTLITLNKGGLLFSFLF